MSIAEVSGDHHAAAFIRGLRELDPSIIVEGLGGPRMREAGGIIHHETVGRAAMLHHALGRVTEIWRLLKWTRAHFDATPPDLHVCVDSSGMNFHFARVAHERGVPVLYYIAPQLWASREYRMKKLKRWVNRVACILPFEEAYFRGHGVDATFVGHPLFDEIPADRPSLSRPPAAQELATRPPVVGMMPGSRKAEVRANFPHMLAVARHIRAAFPGTGFLVPTTPSTHAVASEFAAAATDLPELQLAQDAVDEMIPRCDLCIAKSGTTTLHVAAHGVPMIIVYRLDPFVMRLGARLIVKTKSIGLVNLLSGPAVEDRIVPEIFPWHGSDLPVAQLALDLLRHPEKLDEQRERILKLIATLDRRGASKNAATMAMGMMGMKRTEKEGGLPNSVPI